MKGDVRYNKLQSFRQKYVNEEYKTRQVNKMLMTIGKVININVEGEKAITEKISAAVGVLFPVSTNWSDDQIFYKYDYSDDTQQIARNKFSIGINISCYYNF